MHKDGHDVVSCLQAQRNKFLAGMCVRLTCNWPWSRALRSCASVSGILAADPAFTWVATPALNTICKT